MPASLRFDFKARAAVKRGVQTTYVVFSSIFYNIIFLFTICSHRQLTLVFMWCYPLLGGLFLQSDFRIQACLIPVFFIIRAGFEYSADAITSHTFGSDGMPALNYVGVLTHEICLSIMITSIKHPLVFASLVFSDVLENTFCLWSLSRNAKSSNRVSPEEDEGHNRHSRKSLTRRPSNVMLLLSDKSNVSDKGTSLFIAATLLQREVVETFVPIQAAVILTLLHKVNVKSNSVVNGWDHEDWTQTILYIGIDLGVELLVLVGTIITLHRFYPQFSAVRILRGILRMHWVEMSLLSTTVWMISLIFQTTYAGVDMTMRFSWLDCKNKENSTWLGGFEWEC